MTIRDVVIGCTGRDGEHRRKSWEDFKYDGLDELWLEESFEWPCGVDFDGAIVGRDG